MREQIYVIIYFEKHAWDLFNKIYNLNILEPSINRMTWMHVPTCTLHRRWQEWGLVMLEFTCATAYHTLSQEIARLSSLRTIGKAFIVSNICFLMSIHWYILNCRQAFNISRDSSYLSSSVVQGNKLHALWINTIFIWTRAIFCNW